MRDSIEHDCLVRDDGRCFRCGIVVLNSDRSCHHRQLRSAGGSDTAENRITLCGSGTTGCHGFVHTAIIASRGEGWMVSRWGDPELVPVRHWRDGMVYLTPGGGIVSEAERQAREESSDVEGTER